MNYVETIAIALREIADEEQGFEPDLRFIGSELLEAQAIIWDSFVDRGVPASWRTVSESE